MTEGIKTVEEDPGMYSGKSSCSPSSSEGFLWTERKAHIMGVLPYLTLLLRPRMHFFTHRGQEGHTGRCEGHDKHPGRSV